MTAQPTPEKPSVGDIMREAAAALHQTMAPDKREWHELTVQEQGWWGLQATPTVLAVILTAKPEGWMDMISEVQAMASMWFRSGVPAQRNPITGVVPK